MGFWRGWGIVGPGDLWVPAVWAGLIEKGLGKVTFFLHGNHDGESESTVMQDSPGIRSDLRELS